MKPGLRESFKGFWSRPNREAAWAWASDRFIAQGDHSTDGSDVQWKFYLMANKARKKAFKKWDKNLCP